MTAQQENSNISVVVITRDPYFRFALRGLLGRSRRVRIHSICDSLDTFKTSMQTIPVAPQAAICDLDSISQPDDFFNYLRVLVDAMPDTHFICLAEGNLAHVASQLETIPISALLSKSELGYCLHLAVDAIVNMKVLLITEAVRSLLHENSYLAVHGKTIGPQQDHPSLSARLAEIVVLRILVGLDNADIQDELLLGGDTVRDYVSRAYKTLGVSDELGAFNALSEWWWATRFSHLR